MIGTRALRDSRCSGVNADVVVGGRVPAAVRRDGYDGTGTVAVQCTEATTPDGRRSVRQSLRNLPHHRT
jgi:hypothetical protein